MLIIDFETRSPCDLTVRGAWNYARDPSTEVICCAFGMADSDEVWTFRNPLLFDDSTPVPEWVHDAIHDPECLIAAHNVPFDRAIWRYTGHRQFPVLFSGLPLSRWYDTAAVCRINGLPASLDNATRALNAQHRKDHRGSALIRACSIPPYDESPAVLAELVDYCEKDLRATRELVQRCRPMTQEEHADWIVSERINDNGVCIDRELATYAIGYADEETAAIAARLTQITNGRITKHTQVQRVKALVRDNISPEAEAVMARYVKGELKHSLDKVARAELLDRAAEFNIPNHIVELIELVDDGNKSSVAKFNKMLAIADPEDDRVHGAFVYAGAGQTQRFASRGLQLHNMRRDCFGQHAADTALDHMAEGQPLENVMDTLAKLLRPAIIPSEEDRVFVVADWSAIEARGLPWLSQSKGGEQMLNVFRRDEDPYVFTAQSMGLGEDDRQLGKVALLSMGYGGAVGAFNAMGRNYGVHLPEHQVITLVKKWRRANAWAPTFWYALHEAAVQAMLSPGREYSAGRVRYLFLPKLLDGTLLAILPGDTILQYPRARLRATDRGNEITALKASWLPKADDKDWPRVTLWHGLLAENATQAFCAMLLRRALRELDARGRMVVSHCHDDIVVECDEEGAYAAQKDLRGIMEDMEDVAPGLPLKAEPVTCYRYGHKG